MIRFKTIDILSTATSVALVCGLWIEIMRTDREKSLTAGSYAVCTISWVFVLWAIRSERVNYITTPTLLTLTVVLTAIIAGDWLRAISAM
jgi:hypothetical protein